jgi:hypothetical protein
MHLGQMMFVLAGIFLLGIVILTANDSLLESTDVMNDSEFGITSVSLATSIVEEAMGKMYDEVIADSTTGALSNPSQLSSTLGSDGAETYRGAANDFNDFDDFNNLFLVYKSDNPADTASTPGSNWETIVPGIRSKYFVRTKVVYVPWNNLDGVSGSPTWHKKIIVTVTRPQPHPTKADTLVFPAVMSYWN